MSQLSVGIAGYGVVGKRRHHFIDQHPKLQVTAICDRTLEDRPVDSNGIAKFSDYNQLLQSGIDALFVCLPNNVAPDVTIAGLEARLHVFCEKPPGRNPSDIERVLSASALRPDQQVMYGFNHRYHDSVVDALDLVRSQKLGRIINMRGVYGKSKILNFGTGQNWRSSRAIAGGGILLDQGIHMVDLMRLFAGEFIDVKSFISNDFWKHDVEDNAYALMRSESGIIAFLHSSATQWRHRFSLEIGLELGGINLEGILSGSKSYGAEKMTVIFSDDHYMGDPREQTTQYNKDPSWANEIDGFAKAVLEGVAPTHGSIADAKSTMDLVYQIYRADTAWRQEWDL